MHEFGSTQIDSTLRLLGARHCGSSTWGAFHTEKWPCGCERIRSCRAVTNVSGTVPRVVETVRDKQVLTEKTSHQHAHTPAHPVPILPTRTPWLVCSNLTFEINSSKLRLLTRRRKRHGLRKTNSASIKSRPTDRSNVAQQRKNCTTSFVAHQPTPEDTKEYACTGNFWTIVPRGDGGENGLSSGTSGQTASRDDGAIFLTAAKTKKRSVRWGSSSPSGVPPRNAGHDLIRRNEQTVRVCAVHASLTPIRRKAYIFSFSIFENFLDVYKKRNSHQKNQRGSNIPPTSAHATAECAQRCPVKQLFHANRDMTQNNCTTLNEISLIEIHVPPRLPVVQ